ncbi:DUF1016 N-terminal domain-containing protein [Chryseobacterium terrae]|uniref:DUF1016 N-terminal domain-containing protein n=1 Tax=Chryseobacterium terrae TaxID=3163299 RepID=A0ABW8Y1Z8_9FLAO
MSNGLTNEQLLKSISALLENARNKVVVAVNQTIVLTYFDIGRMIVEDEQNGENRAEYGKTVLKDLSLHLTKKFGRGFSEDNLSNMRKFYQNYSNQAISETLSRNSKDPNSQTLPVNFEISCVTLYRKITNRFSRVNISQYCQVKKILLTY